jgi:formate-dependent nitrite reductase membrane component NrfD
MNDSAYDALQGSMRRAAGRGYSGETYYDTPSVKPSPFDWRVALYLFVSSISGGAQLIASIANQVAPMRLRSVVKSGRAIAVAGAIVGPILLVGDLKTPRRWYNMLRIYRSTSPMSIGTYILTAFGATSVGSAAADALGSRSAARLIDPPAAAAAAGMLTYTGALLSSSSTPLWAAQSPLLSAKFAASGIASGAAALTLAEAFCGTGPTTPALEHLAIAATVTYGAIGRASEAKTRAAGVAGPMEHGRTGAMHKTGKILSIAVPLACHAINALRGRRSRALSIAAALSTITGAAISRFAELEAGKTSAKSARDYLRYTSGEVPR